MPLRRLVWLLFGLGFAACRYAPEQRLKAGPEAGQALALAFEVSQVARQTAEAAARSGLVGCRPVFDCPEGPRSVETTLTLRRAEANGSREQIERRRWEQDGSGSVACTIERSVDAAQGGASTHTLSLRRVAGRRYGSWDGAAVSDAHAPLLDQRLDADPQAEFDAIWNAATQGTKSPNRCRGEAAALPGRAGEASANMGERSRELRMTRTLDNGATLTIEASERLGCEVETLRAPPVLASPGDEAEGSAVQGFASKGLRDGWLLAPPPEPATPR